MVAAFCNAKLCVTYPRVMLTLYIAFACGMVILFLLRRRQYKKAPGWWIGYRWSSDFLKGMVFLMLLAVLFYGSAEIRNLCRANGSVGKITVAQAEQIAVEHRGQSILEQADVLYQLSPDSYRKMTVQEKMNVLHRVMQIEAEYLGVETPELQCVSMEGNTVGTYVKAENKILLNENYLLYEETILRGLLHEMYHAYQYACVNRIEERGELLFFRQVDQWQQEFAKYSLTDEGYLDYYVKSIESTARQYAEERLKEYSRLIVLGNTP